MEGARQAVVLEQSLRCAAVPLALAFPRALANLYEDPEWSQKDLAGPTELLKSQVTKSKLGVLAPSQLQRYRQELAERARLGYPTCFTNLWALVNEALLHDGVRGGCSLGSRLERGATLGSSRGKGPGHQEAVASGSNHLPRLSPMTTNSQTSGRP